MPWFRWRRKDDTQDPAAQNAADAEAPAPTEPEPEEEPGDEEPDDPGETPKPKRRRGTRGGRGRRKTTVAGGAAPETAPRAKPEPAPRERKKDGEERRAGRPPARRRQQRRAPLPVAKRELLISVDVGEQRVAMLEDGRVAEVYLERPERRSIAGNIYLGIVDNVLPGMEAAFVEIGLEKNGFLYVDEIVVPELEGRRHGKKIQDLIQRGQQILVQAVKDPMKTKGARLTTEISLPGRFLVFVPTGEGLGVSRRLDDGERTRLKDIIKNLDVKEGGVIVRTAAEGASAEDVERDLVFLQRLWKTIQARAKAAKAPELVYQEAELPLRIVRDLFAGDFVAAQVDNERAYRRIVGYLKKTSPHMLERVHRYREKDPLFERYGVDREIESTLSRRVDLPSGGYLVFDYAEAFTVIDVNTGRFVGSRSKSSTARLEDTLTKNNLEAVKEVVRQLRLRDVGGIIVIDFIDMANPKNRAQVEEALRNELERDRTKTYVVEISPLGLVEMTRQNVTEGPREILTRKCPVCEGDGIVVSDQTTAMLVERKLRALAGSGARVQAYRVALHPRVLSLVVGSGGSRLAEIEEVTRRRFYLVPAENGHVHADHFQVVAEGKLADLQPEAPVDEGAELELKLVEVGLHDPAAGVGKVEGYDVVVAGAAKLVGKKAKVHVGRVLEGAGYASLVGVQAGEEPITFESEAEKPTRAPSRRRAAPEAEPAEEEASGVGLEEEAAAGESVVEGHEDEAAQKKRTRRGTRGGRRRKKKPDEAPAAAEASATGEEFAVDALEEPVADERAADEPAADARAADEPAAKEPAADEPAAKRPASRRRRRTPKIHVPAADLEAPPEPQELDSSPNGDEAAVEVAAETGEGGEGEDAVKPKRRTRRGTRGGRSRRKKTAAGEGNDDEEAAPEPESSEPVVLEAEGASYVPMAQWLDDFERPA